MVVFFMRHSWQAEGGTEIYPSYFKLPVRWLRSFTLVTYTSKLLGTPSLAASLGLRPRPLRGQRKRCSKRFNVLSRNSNYFGYRLLLSPSRSLMLFVRLSNNVPLIAHLIKSSNGGSGNAGEKGSVRLSSALRATRE